MSLVEVLVAVGVLVAGAMSLAPLFVMAASATATARGTTYATVLASQKVEELRGLDRADPAGEIVEYIDRLGEEQARAEAAYERRWTIRSIGGDASLVAIDVAVAARVGRGDARLVTVRLAGAP